MSNTVDLRTKLIAELVGTFLFVFVGAGSAVAFQYLGVSDPGTSLLIAALANGLGLAIGISITTGVSGGLLNPAVPIGHVLGRQLPASNAIPYVIGELIRAPLDGMVSTSTPPT